MFLESGLPRISERHMSLIKYHNLCKLHDGDCKKCVNIQKMAKNNIIKIVPEKEKAKGCVGCLYLAYSSGIEEKTLTQLANPSSSLCVAMDVLASRNLGATFKTNCPVSKDTLTLFTNEDTELIIEPIIKGLKLKYSNDIDLKNYLDLLDSKTTRAIREITKKIAEDPFTKKYSERMNSIIFEYNKEIEEIGKSRFTKFYEAISDITVYGGSKLLENQTQSYFQARKKDLDKLSEWLASKLMDVHAIATGKDWTLAQLYRTRFKLENCKKIEGNKE